MFDGLDKLKLIWWFDFRLKPIFATAQATPKIYCTLKK